MIIQSKIQMKEQLVSDIPQENLSQTQSMYEQLRRTSEKCLLRSHKRIFLPNTHKTRHNIDTGSAQYSLISQISSPREGFHGGDRQNKQRMMNLMREQIQTACHLYANKTKNLLLDQARKIQALGELLAKNQVELRRKDAIIKDISQKINNIQVMQCDLGNKQKQIQGIANRRLSVLEQGLNQIAGIINRNGKSNIGKSYIENHIKNVVSQTVNNFQIKVDEFIQSGSQRIDKIQKIMIMRGNVGKNVKNGNIFQASDKNQLVSKIQRISQQIDRFRHQIESLQKRKYTYDNYKIEEVQSKISKLQDTIYKLEATKNSKSKQTDTKSKNVRQIGSKASQLTHMTRTQFALSEEKSSKYRFISKYKSLINNRKQRQTQMFSNSSLSESEVQQTLLDESEGTVDRFLRMVDEMRMNKPLKIEMDQTGYAKSVDSGMYLVDGTGNGFQLSAGELDYLTSQGIVEI